MGAFLLPEIYLYPDLNFGLCDPKIGFVRKSRLNIFLIINVNLT